MLTYRSKASPMHRSCASRIRARRGRRRRMMFVATDYATYEANELNQYTRINTNGTDFTPEYDADGNQTRLQRSFIRNIKSTIVRNAQNVLLVRKSENE